MVGPAPQDKTATSIPRENIRRSRTYISPPPWYTPPAMPDPRPPDPDLPLLHAARAGDYDAFEKLVEKYQRRIYTLASRILHNPHDAEEIVQETFIAVLEHLADFQEQALFSTWLIRIATNRSLKSLAKRNTRAAISLDTPPGDDEGKNLPHPDFIATWKEEPSAIAANREIGELIARELETLDEKHRLVFILRDIEGLSTEETADMLGITVSNTKVRLLRARLALRERLTSKLGDPSRRVIGHKHDEK